MAANASKPTCLFVSGHPLVTRVHPAQPGELYAYHRANSTRRVPLLITSHELYRCILFLVQNSFGKLTNCQINIEFVWKVFVEALDDAPAHARRALFSTLVDSLGEESLAIISALLLRRAVSFSGSDVGGKSADVETTSALIEFVHQTIHRSRARGQVKTGD